MELSLGLACATFANCSAGAIVSPASRGFTSAQKPLGLPHLFRMLPMSHFSELSTLPPDALLGLMTAFRADPRGDKYDLGVGVYKDEAGETPILTSVKKAEARLLAAQSTKVYEGPRGNTDYCGFIEDFVFGKDHPARQEGRTISFTTPGGCGALFQGVSLMRRTGTKRVWVSKPTWPNHPNVVKSLGLEVMEYAYARDGEFYRLGMLADLSTAEAGDGVIIQGPCPIIPARRVRNVHNAQA